MKKSKKIAKRLAARKAAMPSNSNAKLKFNLPGSQNLKK